MLVRIWKSWNPHILLVGMQNGAATVEVYWVFKEVKYRITKAIPLLGIYTQRIENKCSNKHLYTNVQSSILDSLQKVETAHISINRRT